MIAAVYPAHSIWPLRRVEEDPLAFLQALAANGADLVPFHLGRRPAFLLNHPALVEDVFVAHADKFVKGRGFDRARRLLGNGLLTSTGAFHAERRRVASGAFHRGRMAEYAPIIVSHARRMADRWQPGRAIDVARDMHELTLTIAGEALFGADSSSCAAEVASAVAAATPPMDALVSLVAPLRQARTARRRLDGIIDGIVERRLQSGQTRIDLLSLLLEARDGRDPASAQALRDDAVTFLLAGHDTIAHALTWTWMLLAEHPEVEDQLSGELREVLGNRTPNGQDLERLVFTRSVLAESLRLFPPAWVIVRRAVEAHQCAGTLMPVGAIVVASPFVMQRDARFFHEPLTFNPGRWRSGSKAGYFPFGAGARSCIGEGFAWMEGTLALATLAQSWRLARPRGAPMPASPRITLRPKGTILMTPGRRRIEVS